MKSLLTLCTSLMLLLFFNISSKAQSVAINDDGSAAHPSAMLDVKVTAAAKKGVLVPGMTSAQRIAIAAPAKGLLVFDTSTSSFWYYNGVAWTQLSVGGANPWAFNGSHIYNTNKGNVGIGVSSPRALLNVAQNRSVVFGLDSLSTTAGPSLVWFGKQAALRFSNGEFTSDGWNSANIGVNSLGIGDLTTASGPQSFAQGYGANASGYYSYARGFATSASGNDAFAQGTNVAAEGDQSFVFGYTSRAKGYSSFAVGYDVLTTGEFSQSFGVGTVARSSNSFVLGAYNDSIASSSTTSWNAGDPLFIVGNGTGYSARKNAFTILKNGLTGIGVHPNNFSASYGSLQVKSILSKHNLTLIAPTTTNRWSFYVGTSMNLYYNGALRGTFSSTTGAYASVSDLRLKKNIIPMTSILHTLNLIPSYMYRYIDSRDDEPLTRGFMAQDVMKYFPDLVNRVADNYGNELFTLNYQGLTVIAIKAIQEQQQIITDQQKQIDDLNKKLNKVETDILERVRAMEKKLK